MQSNKSLTLLIAFKLIASAVATPLAAGCQQSSDCNSVQIFIARGSIEPYPGRQGALADAICEGIASCGYTDIGYPATFGDYCVSIQAGVTNGTALIADYVERCPSAKIILTGYSQGANVVGDILGGGGGSGVDGFCEGGVTQPYSKGLNHASRPGRDIVAALLFGDVRHTASQPYNTGTGAANDGRIWPREEKMLKSLSKFASVLRSWCIAEDPVCARGTEQSAHVSYFEVFIPEAAAWAKSKL